MDLGTVVATVLRPGLPANGRDERIAFSLRLLAPLLDGRLRLDQIGGDLAREIRNAGPDTRAALILPAGPGPARIDLGGRQFTVPGALRDALVTLLSKGANASAPAVHPGATNGAAGETSALARLPTQALVAAASAATTGAGAALADALMASGATRALRQPPARPVSSPVAFDAPLFDPRDPARTAQRIAARVTDSGLFFEAHVVQMARGERAPQSVQAEARQLSQAAADDVAAVDARAARQFETLQRQSVALSGPAWHGQPLELELGREAAVMPDGEAAGAFEREPVLVAHLRLDLPHLGAVDVRLRLAGETIAATVAGDDPSIERLAEALPQLGAAFSARGLTPAALQAIAATTTAQDAP